MIVVRISAGDQVLVEHECPADQSQTELMAEAFDDVRTASALAPGQPLTLAFHDGTGRPVFDPITLQPFPGG